MNSRKLSALFIKRASFFTMVFLVIACAKTNSSPDFEPDFSFQNNQDLPNTIDFVNKTSGPHTFTQWDFGNGEKTEKLIYNNKHSVFYTEKGDYNVTLTVWNEDDFQKSVSKIVTIDNSLFSADFDAEVDTNNPNFVNLTNTTTGEYDGISWILDNNEYNHPDNQITAYIEFKGIYDITLRVFKGDFERSITKQITIVSDDPDYLNKYNLVWSDEFDSTAVNLNNWTFETGSNGWGNNELQNYTNGNNADVTDDKLMLTARKVNDDKEVGSYTSTRMVTKGKREFKYGRMEIRAKLPSGTGIWPAIWMLGSNINDVGWPACGEIDIMEYVGFQSDVVRATVHTTSGYGGNGSGSNKALPTCEEEFHNYGLIWNEKELLFYVDSTSNVIHRYAPSTKNNDNWPFDQQCFFILNVAVGGTWGGAEGIDNSIFPQSMVIDYVRVYQPVLVVDSKE